MHAEDEHGEKVTLKPTKMKAQAILASFTEHLAGHFGNQ
jgi:hypothetical protein